MLIICKNCAATREWKKLQHEKLKDQRCDKCGGNLSRLDCFKEGCRYLQYKKCEEAGKCIKRLEAK